jgi:predicted nucleic acid-binding Zn ribbon protein
MIEPKRPKMKRPASVSELLSSIFSGKPAGSRLKEGKIWEVWNSAVGPQIASRARPTAIRNGILTVAVNSSPWLQQLNFLKVGIRDKLNEAIGEEMIKDIFLKAGTFKEEPSEEKIPKPSKRPLTAQEEAVIAKTTEEIIDPELRKTLASLFESQLSSNSRK